MFENMVDEEVTSTSRIKKSEDIEAKVTVMPNGKTKQLEGVAKSGDKQYFVVIDDLGDFYCTCRDYQIRGLACKHVLAVLRKLSEDKRKDMVDKMIRKYKFDNT